MKCRYTTHGAFFNPSRSNDKYASVNVIGTDDGLLLDLKATFHISHKISYPFIEKSDCLQSWKRSWQDKPMMMSSNGNISALLAICAGNSPVTGEFPTQGPVTRSFDVYFDLCLNKRLSKQSWGWWFETPSRPLWRHHNASCYPNQFLLIGNRNFRNKFNWYYNHSRAIIIKENELENVFCQMAASWLSPHVLTQCMEYSNKHRWLRVHWLMRYFVWGISLLLSNIQCIAMINFLPNPLNRHPIVCLCKQDIACLLQVQTVIGILPRL